MCVFISGWRCWPMFTFLLFRLWVAWPHQGSIIRHSYYLGVSGFFSIAVASIVQSSLIWLCVGTKADDGAHHCGIFALIGGVELRFSGCLFFYYTSRENDDEHIKYPSASVDCPHDDWNQNRNHIIIRINNKVYLMDWIIGANKRQLFLYVFCGTPNKKVFFSFLFLFPNNNPQIWNHSYTSSDANVRNWPNSRSSWEWTIAAIWLDILFWSWTFRRWDRVCQPNRKIKRKKENGVQWTLYTRSLH